jgi:hypothetical protein
MKIFAKGRGEGKTHELIEMSHNTNNCIVVHSKSEVDRISKYAKNKGLNIPEPMTYRDILNGKYVGTKPEGLLIDNVEIFIKNICPDLNIEAISLTVEKEKPRKEGYISAQVPLEDINIPLPNNGADCKNRANVPRENL